MISDTAHGLEWQPIEGGTTYTDTSGRTFTLKPSNALMQLNDLQSALVGEDFDDLTPELKELAVGSANGVIGNVVEFFENPKVRTAVIEGTREATKGILNFVDPWVDNIYDRLVLVLKSFRIG